MTFRRKKVLKEAAIGSAKITNFFQPKETVEELESEQEDEPAPLSSLALSSYANFWAQHQQQLELWAETPRGEEQLGLVSQSVVHSNSATQTDVPGVAEIENFQPETIGASNTVEFLDVSMDDEQDEQRPAVGIIVGRLIKEAQKHHSFASLFKLQAVKNYLGLFEKYKNIPQIRNPKVRSSTTIAYSVGKGPYFAKQIRKLALYINRFHSLPPTGSGKHHAHPSLLNDERVAHAVRRYLTVTALGEVRSSNLNKYKSHTDPHRF